MRLIFISGFAMFTMFFGSGNLVFPLNLGVQQASHGISALLGLICTAVIVPFLGLIALMLCEGSYQKFFSLLGKTLTFILVASSLALMGPFGVIPRCMWVGYGGLSVMDISFSFSSYAFLFLALMTIMIWNKNRVIDIVAYILTPFKFGSIGLLLIFGLWKAKAPFQNVWSVDAFWHGLTEGYQTMDLIASFFFATTIYNYIKSKKKADSSSMLIRCALKASCVGGGLLALVYAGFVFIGSLYAKELQGVEPQNMLATVAKDALGYQGLVLVAFTIIVACLATATVLSNLFVDFLRKDLSYNYLSHSVCVFITVFLSFALSLMGFKSICAFLATFLSWAYPFLIVYAVVQIVRHRNVIHLQKHLER